MRDSWRISIGHIGFSQLYLVIISSYQEISYAGVKTSVLNSQKFIVQFEFLNKVLFVENKRKLESIIKIKIWKLKLTL